jgi:hypothetical protein
MRRIQFTAALFAIATTLSAADDPFVGRWKMNPEKSKYTQGAPPKEQIATITVADGQMQVKVNAITSDDRKTVVYYTIPYDGGPGKMFETSPAYDGISGTKTSAYEREIIRWKDGKAVFTAHSVISPDGNTMSTVSKGISPVGKPVDAHVFYDKLK